MTEDEAKKKWCPMVRAGHVSGMAVNVDINGDFEDINRCIGTQCMMWRWGYEYPHEERPYSGYCGLAGPIK